MQQTLNIDGFIQYAYSTGKYNGDQLQVIADAPVCSGGGHGAAFMERKRTLQP